MIKNYNQYEIIDLLKGWIEIESVYDESTADDKNPFGKIGVIIVYNECIEWLKDVTKYIKGNYELLKV